VRGLATLLIGTMMSSTAFAQGAPIIDLGNATLTATGSSTSRAMAMRHAERVNILDYGAVNDAVGYADGTIAAGSTSFSSASATFTTSDVGKRIYLDGVGANGSPLQATITGLGGDSHTVTLSAAATFASTNTFATSAAPATSQSGAGSYQPGDTITLTGGTASQQAQVTVATTKVVSAVANAAGSGGTNGQCIVTGTTGSFRKVRVNVTINGGAISAVGAIWDPGAYSTNPTNLTAEPVTGCGLSSATLTLKMGVSTSVLTQPGSYSSMPSNPVAQGSTSGSGTGATFTATSNPGGTYVYGTDNTNAIGSAVAVVNARASLKGQFSSVAPAGTVSCLYIPSFDPAHPTGAGYLVASQPTQFSIQVPGCVMGDTMENSVIILGAGFNGHLFSTDEAWVGGSATPVGGAYPFGGSVPASIQPAGPYFGNFSVHGNTLGSGTQDAIVFLDRTNWAFVENIGCLTIRGRCIATGDTAVKPASATSMSESVFKNIRAWSAGSPTTPAFDYKGVHNNEVYFERIDLLRCFSTCLEVTNTDPGGAGSAFANFFMLRGEKSMIGDDIIRFGSPLLQGSTTISVIGLIVSQVPTDHAGVRLTCSAPGTCASGPSQLDHVEINGSGHAFQLDAAQFVDIKGSFAPMTQAAVVIGPGVGRGLTFDTLGSEVTYQIDPSVMQKVRTIDYGYGSPVAVFNGNARTGSFIFEGTTTNTTPVVLTMDSTAANTMNLANPPNSTTYYGHVECLARGTNDIAAWNDGANGTVLRREVGTGTTTVPLGTLASRYASPGAAGWTFTEAADTVNGGLQITVTGAAGVSIHWACQFTPIQLQ
jgi:hypothetical protein